MASKKIGEISEFEGFNLNLAFSHPGPGSDLGPRMRELTLHRNVLWVSSTGTAARGYGSFSEPYATLEAAVAAMTATKLTVAIMPGTYTLAAAVVPPVAANGGRIVAPFGGVTIVESGSYILDIDPAAAGTAWSFNLENVKIQHTECVGLQIDNSAVAQAMTVNLKNVQFDMVTSGNSIDVDHSTAGKTMLINIDNDDKEVEGAVNVVFKNAGDAFRVRGTRLTGGLVTSNDNLAVEILLASCEVKHEGITGGHAGQKLYALNCWTKAGEVYARLDTSDTAGDHTAYVKDDSSTDFGSEGLQTDLIAESTGAAGVTIDGLKIKDAIPYCDTIAEKTGETGVTADGVLMKDAALYTDTIGEVPASGNGVTVDGVLCKDGEVTADVIHEKTSDTGVTLDSVLLKDGEVSVDVINEATGATGVTIDGVKLKDSIPYCNTIAEKTSGSGVTVDGVLLKDAEVTTDVINEKTGAAGVTIDGVKLKDSVPYCNSIAEKTDATGVTVDGVLCKDAEVYTDVIHEVVDSTNGVTVDSVLLKDGAVSTDTINELGAGNGVTIDGVKLKDSEPYCDAINEKSNDTGVTVDGVLLKDGEVTTDTIKEKTGGGGVTIDGVKLKDSVPYCDSIAEKSEATGVTVDGVLCKDAAVYTDTIGEVPASGNGVTVDSVLLKDGEVSTDTINELGAGNGVTIDGVKLKDSAVTTDTINEKTGDAGVTIDGVQLKDSVPYCDSIAEKTGGVGVTVDSVLLKDGAATVVAGAANAAAALRFGATVSEGLEYKVIDEDVTVGGAAANYDLTEDVPDGAAILAMQVNLETAVTGAGGCTKVGLGVAADPNKYGLSGDLLKNTKIDTIPAHAVLSGAEDVRLYACDNAGDAAGTIASATVRVRIVYAALNSLDDAA